MTNAARTQQEDGEGKWPSICVHRSHLGFGTLHAPSSFSLWSILEKRFEALKREHNPQCQQDYVQFALPFWWGEHFTGKLSINTLFFGFSPGAKVQFPKEIWLYFYLIFMPPLTIFCSFTYLIGSKLVREIKEENSTWLLSVPGMIPVQGNNSWFCFPKLIVYRWRHGASWEIPVDHIKEVQSGEWGHSLVVIKDIS